MFLLHYCSLLGFFQQSLVSCKWLNTNYTIIVVLQMLARKRNSDEAVNNSWQWERDCYVLMSAFFNIYFLFCRVATEIHDNIWLLFLHLAMFMIAVAPIWYTQGTWYLKKKIVDRIAEKRTNTFDPVTNGKDWKEVWTATKKLRCTSFEKHEASCWNAFGGKRYLYT